MLARPYHRTLSGYTRGNLFPAEQISVSPDRKRRDQPAVLPKNTLALWRVAYQAYRFCIKRLQATSDLVNTVSVNTVSQVTLTFFFENEALAAGENTLRAHSVLTLEFPQLLLYPAPDESHVKIVIVIIKPGIANMFAHRQMEAE